MRISVLHSAVLHRVYARNTGGLAMRLEGTVDALGAGLWNGFGGPVTGARLPSATAAAAAAAVGAPVIYRDTVKKRVSEGNGQVGICSTDMLYGYRGFAMEMATIVCGNVFTITREGVSNIMLWCCCLIHLMRSVGQSTRHRCDSSFSRRQSTCVSGV